LEEIDEKDLAGNDEEAGGGAGRRGIILVNKTLWLIRRITKVSGRKGKKGGRARGTGYG